MPEDQGVNGRMWAEQAANLLQFFGWEKIGDLDMDLVDEDGDKKGIDSLFIYEDPPTNIPEGFLIEAKSYKQSSLSSNDIAEWVNIAKEKITKIRHSDEVLQKFPKIADYALQNILLMIQIREITDPIKLKSLFQEGYNKVSVREKGKQSKVNIFIIDNERLQILLSIANSQVDENKDYQFFYPAMMGGRKISNHIANIYSLFSNFIILRKIVDEKAVDDFLVYFFGEPIYKDYAYLYNALKDLQILDANGSLTIKYYNGEDSEFRKIKEDITKLFTEKDGITFHIHQLTKISNIPHWLKE